MEPDQVYGVIDEEDSPDQQDGLLHKKALKSHQDRKKSEEDIQILKNRIKLLQAEEERVAKMADEAKKRTEKIISTQ
jgi:hypothetical protein